MENALSSESHEADFIIIGAGTAGCVLANRLSADPATQVLLIEAGGSDAHPLLRMPVGFVRALGMPQFSWGYHSEPEPHLNGRVIHIPRGRVLGGSSTINGLFHIRGNRLDFDDWAAAGCAGWSYAEALPYFTRSENHALGAGPFHGGEGPVQVRPIDPAQSALLLDVPLRQAALAAGYRLNEDYDGEQHEGMARGTVAIDSHGRRHSSARAYLAPIRQRSNLRIWTQTLTERVIIENGRAMGVAVVRGGQRTVLRARREVLLAGGTYGSPQLLLLSGIGPENELRELGIGVQGHLPGVGRNLIEHPRMPLQISARQPVTFLNQLRLDRAILCAARWALFGTGPFATQICSGTLLFKSKSDLDRPDTQLLCNPVRLDAKLWLPGWGPRQAHSFYITVCQLYAKSRGSVRLRSARVQDAPRIALNLFSHEDDLTQMRAAIRAARALYRTAPMDALAGEELLPGGALQTDAQLDEAIRSLGGITHHPVGTCAMGTGPQAVVDAQLRVHGVQGLRVVDASIMPSMVGGNTNAATLMIAEKAADMILGQRLPPATLPLLNASAALSA